MRSGDGRCGEACDLLRFLRGNTLPIGLPQGLLVGVTLLGRLRVNAQLGCTRRRWLLLPKRLHFAKRLMDLISAGRCCNTNYTIGVTA
ncbi:hypothetical protein LMG919_00665 [Xanthomonas vesicatoria]|nr:hypothetical protein LMG919_00665 [Xanthomonas vesicatoria]